MEPLQRIYAAIAAVPHGQVATYGGIAARAGLPGRARWVARALAEAPAALRLPWHRIVAAGGRIALPAGSEAHAEQVRRLQREGHVVRNNRVALPAPKDESELDALLWAPPAPRGR
jgi:methylated-DNA-protein-cysteine methyltransferase-like protein